MLIELLNDIREPSTAQEKAIKALYDSGIEGDQLNKAVAYIVKRSKVKVTERKNREQRITWKKGTQILVSDATGEKLIKKGLAKKVEQRTD